MNAGTSIATGSNDGETDALEQVFQAHYGRIARVIGRVIHDPARAEEIAVDVFLKWKRTPAAQGEQAAGWLYRTALREALDESRRLTRRARFEQLAQIFRPAAPPTPEQVHQTNVEQRRVRTVLGAVSRRHAELLLLWVEELSYAEMAAALELHPNYVGSLLRRAQEAFRKEYVDRYGK